MLDCKFAMIDRAGEMKLLTIVDSGALFNYMSSSVAKHLGWAIKPNSTLFAVMLANRTVMSSLGVAHILVSCVV